MKLRTLTFEQGAYLLAFLIALGLRLLLLGRLPLSDLEASWALQAADLANGARAQIGAQPGYVLLTSILFFLFQETNFFARLLPALAGSLIIGVPFLFRRQLGRIPAVVIAFALAFEPSLLAISRQADGMALAVSFSLLAGGFLYNRRPAWAGSFGALALLGGTTLWPGLLSLALVLLWSGLFDRQPQADRSESPEPLEISGSIQPVEEWAAPLPWRAALPWFAGTLLLAGTLFFRAPAGLSAVIDSLVVYVSGWGGAANGVPVVQLLLALVVYAPLALLLGLIGLFAGWRLEDRVDRFLGRWFLIALLLALVYPSRQAVDLVWAIVPLWALAGRQTVRMVRSFEGERLALIGHVALVVILLIFTWLNFVVLSMSAGGSEMLQARLIPIAGALALLVLVTALIVWGWSIEQGGMGLVFGLCLFLLIATLSAAWNSTGLGRNPSAEIWQRSPQIGQADLLLKTARDFSEWNARGNDSLDLFVEDIDSPALRWALRDYSTAQFVDVLPGGSAPSMLLTASQDPPQLAAEYTGQDFTWEQSTDWTALFEGNWMRWPIVRQAPQKESLVVLWVRSDLFVGAGQPPTGDASP